MATEHFQWKNLKNNYAFLEFSFDNIYSFLNVTSLYVNIIALATSESQFNTRWFVGSSITMVTRQSD